MKVVALFDRKGKVLALFHESKEADAPRLEFHPSRGQRSMRLEVPPELERLTSRELHAAVAVKLEKAGARLVKRKPRR